VGCGRVVLGAEVLMIACETLVTKVVVCCVRCGREIGTVIPPAKGGSWWCGKCKRFTILSDIAA
jgi:hypothetical protein